MSIIRTIFDTSIKMTAQAVQIVSKCVLWSAVAASSLVLVLLVRTLGLTSREIDIPASRTRRRDEDFVSADDSRIGRFVHGIRCMTVSMEPHVQNYSELTRLRQFIETSEASSPKLAKLKF